MDILDIGCGNGLLWVKEKEILPENINIYLVDNSKAMINAERKLILNEKDYYEKKKKLLDL